LHVDESAYQRDEDPADRGLIGCVVIRMTPPFTSDSPPVR
jgi:hypothetical protein